MTEDQKTLKLVRRILRSKLDASDKMEAIQLLCRRITHEKVLKVLDISDPVKRSNELMFLSVDFDNEMEKARKRVKKSK